jgi:hypothetical protein
MSQRKVPMRVIERESGLEGRLLRPLSARLLPPTEPEKEGLVDRSLLLSLQGRTRRPQMDLIAERGITDYPLPAGGCCFLTDANYSRRFRDKMAHRSERPMDQEDVTLLKAGRHFRVSPALKLVIGRDERENQFLERFAKGERVRFEVEVIPGPVGLTDESVPDDQVERLCASIVARYSDGRDLASVAVRAEGGGRPPRIWETAPLRDEDVLGPMRL